jgi:hypothetical protein
VYANAYSPDRSQVSVGVIGSRQGCGWGRRNAISRHVSYMIPIKQPRLINAGGLKNGISGKKKPNRRGLGF